MRDAPAAGARGIVWTTWERADIGIPVAHSTGLLETRSMTKGAAVIAVVLALMVGYYWARWRRAEGSAKSAKAMADGAGKTVWRARGSMLLVAVAVYVALTLWFHGQGR